MKRSVGRYYPCLAGRLFLLVPGDLLRREFIDLSTVSEYYRNNRGPKNHYSALAKQCMYNPVRREADYRDNGSEHYNQSEYHRQPILGCSLV